MKLEIEIHKTKDMSDISYVDIDVETPTFTMMTETSLQILQNKELGATCFTVYMVILNFRNMTNNQCFPSISAICKKSGLGRSTVKKAIDKLEKYEFISINSGYKGTANNYYFPKEWFYELFDDDFYQQRATRRHNPIKDKRETKIEKENKQLKKTITELQQEINKKDNNNYDSYDDEKNPF